MNLTSDIVFSGASWRGPAAAFFLAGCVLVWWSYRSAPVGRRGLCAALKLAGLGLLILCVLEPQWSQPKARPGSNVMVVLADNSSSLLVSDEGASVPRSVGLRTLLDPASSAWQGELEKNFEVRRYQFDRGLQPVEAFGALRFEGRASALGSALDTVATRFRGRPLAGVVVLTDGIATDLAALPENLSGWPPVYPVVIGKKGPARDLSVRKVSVTQTAFEDAPVTVDAEVGVAGSTARSVVARLTDASGKLEEEQTLESGAGNGAVSFRFRIRNAPPGISFHRLSVREAGESGPETAEATLANNTCVVVVDRAQGPYRLLYVAGRPNWEFKFLNRALEADDQVQLAALVRVARREPKFSFLGRAGETSNPLFRGTEDQAKGEVAAYDQPVLVRLNTRDEAELRAGFPTTEEELFGYHAIILDDVESAFFTPAQAALIQRFVSSRGGGFLMLGGMESFSEGGYARTPVGEMLPVTLDRTPAVGGPVELGFNLDRDGWLQPWARLRENEADEKSRLSGMPGLRVVNRVRGVKPGAGVIATADDATGQRVPALVVQRFGRGRSAALMVGDLWRWGMKSPEARVDLEKSWRQLVRWMVADVPGRVSLATVPKPADPAGAMEIQVRVADSGYLPVENATVSLEVEPVLMDAPAEAPAADLSGKNVSGVVAIPGAATNNAGAADSGGGVSGGGARPGVLTLQAEPSATEPGLYVASYVPRETGGYKVTAKAVNAAGAEQGRATAGWATDLAAQELRSLTPDRALLEELARKTGGAVVEPDGLSAFAARLPSLKAPVMEPHEEPLWHTPWIFLTAVACLAGEWGLRRTQGLP
ncbi:MAG: hypothetical protein JWL81_1504 [Verrucomicrobiales bacterium]|nr:hypothetical protein [Verrucomicrobiales bacterium]